MSLAMNCSIDAGEEDDVEARETIVSSCLISSILLLTLSQTGIVEVEQLNELNENLFYLP